jgi:thiol-disulfide isomerase/thioredoxin
MIRYISLLLFIGLAWGQENIFVGDQAPPISLFKLESNKYFRSKELLGKKNLVVSFFATWCGPCAQEIPELIKISKEFGDDFQFLLVDVNEKRDKVKKHIEDKGISLQVVLDKYGVVRKSFGGMDIPLLVVINKKGQITYQHTGYVKGDEKKLKEHLKTL